MNRVDLPERILEERILPVARRLDASTGPRLASALLSAGLGSLEVTMEGKGGLGAVRALIGSGAVVGAGTVMTLEQGIDAVEAGATFLVSPHLNESLVEWAVQHAIPVIPGAMTPTEIVSACDRGASAVKVFPAASLGAGFIASLKGPLPGIALLPTGGVTAENARAFLDAGSVAVGVGSWLTRPVEMSEVIRRAESLLRVV